MSSLATKAIYVSIVACLLSGCAFRNQVTGMAVDYNDFVAEATNRQTAINILRAREREPLHFTSFTKVFGTARVEGSASLTTAFNGNGGEAVPASGGGFDQTKRALGATNWTPTLGIKVNSGTDFEIGVNATDDFWKGIMAPVQPATLVYYLRQGWPPELISHLFIQRMEFSAKVTRPDGKVETIPLRRFLNAPDDEPSVAPFAALIKCRQLGYILKETPKSALPLRDVSSVSSVDTAALGRIEALVGAGTDASYNLNSPARSEFAIALSERGDGAACLKVRAMLDEAFIQKSAAYKFKAPPQPLPSKGGTPAAAADTTESPSEQRSLDLPLAGTESFLSTSLRPEKDEPPAISGAAFGAEGYFKDLLPDKHKGDLVIDVTLRSVEGVIYYLGEYVRKPETSAKLHGICGWETISDKKKPRYGDCIPIIVVAEAEDGGADDFVVVDFEGKRYVIPSSGEDIGPKAGRSSQVVTLVQQMLNLHRSAKDLPSTPVVRVIN